MKRSLDSLAFGLLGVLGLAVSGMGSAGCEGPRDQRPSEPPASEPAPTAAQTSHDVSTHSIDELRVEWPQRSQVDNVVLARMPERARAAVERSTLPVLVPQRAGLTERTQLAVQPAFYAASIRGEGEHSGVHLNVSATKMAHRYPAMPRAEVRGQDARTQRVRGDRPAWVLANEGIWSVTWDENGVSYVVELECARPFEDARCASGDEVVKIANELAFVGGAFDGGAQ